MKLTPRPPPGRTNREARAYSAEIARLYDDGYTCAAVREALIDVGVNVSKSTVQREVARRSKAGPLAGGVAPLAPESRGPPPRSTAPAELLPTNTPRKGKDIAAAFFENRINNLLVRTRRTS
jgi:hypothetical protein